MVWTFWSDDFLFAELEGYPSSGTVVADAVDGVCERATIRRLGSRVHVSTAVHPDTYMVDRKSVV